MKPTAKWLGELPAWAFPLAFLAAIVVHTLLIWAVMCWNHAAIRRADVLVVPHMGDTSVLAVKPASVVLGTPIVYFSHNGLYYPLIENRGLYEPDSIAGYSVKFVDRVLHRLADRVVVFSEASKQAFVDTYGLPASTYDVIYITAIEENFDKSIDASDTDGFDVLYWGNFHPHHGPMAMIEAAAQTPAYDWGFIGESKQRDRLVDAADDLEADNVEFVGFVEFDELVRQIRAANVVLGPVGDNPQTSFTVGTKAAEAAYLEKAIVIGRQPATQEVFTQGESAYFVDPGDADSLADAVRTLLEDDDLRATLETGAFEAYETYFSTNGSTDKFLGIADDLA